jgi:hypothetical protein
MDAKVSIRNQKGQSQDVLMMKTLSVPRKRGRGRGLERTTPSYPTERNPSSRIRGNSTMALSVAARSQDRNVEGA